MGVHSDNWIRTAHEGMIEPFDPQQVSQVSNKRLLSYGASGYGYDLRCGRSFSLFDKEPGQVIDPKDFPSQIISIVQAEEYFVIPPHGFVLSDSIEYFKLPRNVVVTCHIKSTYARCGILIPPTTLEPEWEGNITLEFQNCNKRHGVKIYPGEGIVQLLFHVAHEPCDVSYKDRKGKYQGQRGITLAKG